MNRHLSIALLVALVGSCVTAPAGCAWVGHMRAQSMCDETAIGSSIDDFRVRAKRNMDHVFDVPDVTLMRGHEDEELRDDAATPASMTEEDAGGGVVRETTPAQPRKPRKGQTSAMAVGFVFLRYFCVVEHEDGKITNKHVTSLD